MKIRFAFVAVLILLTAATIFGQANQAKPIDAGDLAPDFTLTDQNGKSVTLSEAVKRAPVVLVFYRGYWCPFCGHQLSDLRRLLKSDEPTQLFAVSIDGADKSREFIKKIEQDGKGKINYQLLADPNAKTINIYGLHDPRYDGQKVDGIPYPTVYVINKERRVAWAKLEKDYKQRPTNEEIRAALDNVK